jgi:hypothetical protein
MVTRDAAGNVTNVRSTPPPDVWARQTAQLRALGAELQRQTEKTAAVHEKLTDRRPPGR